MNQDLPEQLRDFDAFRNWLDANFDPSATTVQKGAGFLEFVINLLPLTERGMPWGDLTKSERHSHDGGVDASSPEHPQRGRLFVQSRLKVPSKADLDAVISGFKNFDQRLDDGAELQLLPTDEKRPPTYGLVVSNKLKGVIEAYEQASLSSRPFYDTLRAERRLLIWDGPLLLAELQRLWAQHYRVPPQIRLNSANGWMRHGDVSIGVIEGGDLARLYEQHGPGLFFENVRGFIGMNPNADRLTVNQSILATATHAPEKMLARNNGVVFRAGSVEPGDSATSLELGEASIVNGLQTTMCLVQVDGAISSECQVLVKVVQASDAWEVAEAANNQNAIGQIDLKLARYFRPQIANQAAAASSIQITSAASARDLTKVLASIRAERADYDQLRYLLIGLFCNMPNQLFQDNYTRLRLDVLDHLYDGGTPPENLYPALFRVSTAANQALVKCEGLVADDPVQRIHDEGKPKYRVYLAILALCASLRQNLSERLDSPEDEAERLRGFLAETLRLFDNDSGQREFTKSFVSAYSVAADTTLEAYKEGDEGRISQQVYKKIRDAPFTMLYNKVLLRIAEHERVAEI